MSIANEIKEIKNKLVEIEKRIQQLEKPPAEHAKSMENKSSDMKSGLAELSKNVGVSEENIKKIYDLEQGSFTLVKIMGEDDREKIKNMALLVLLGNKYLLGNDEVLSQEIRRNVAENKIPQDNFATCLNKITPTLIRKKGKIRSPKTTYRLTTLGKANAKDLLNKACEE
jgi:hypothetical protein